MNIIINKFKFLVLFAALFVLCCHQKPNLSTLFTKRGVKGTLIISSLQGKKVFVHNSHRANEQFSPASTFKILNTLIAVEEKVITPDEIIKWDGVNREFPNWNKDQNLSTAFKISCVWYYQVLAHRVGEKKYRDYLKKTNYGKISLPFDEANFWLDGSLQINAHEQIDFLKKVYRQTAPFSPKTLNTLKHVMLVEQTPKYTIRAKTGWTRKLAWYVGYIETENETWFFALNFDTNNIKDLPKRQLLVREAFQLLDIIP